MNKFEELFSNTLEASQALQDASSEMMAYMDEASHTQLKTIFTDLADMTDSRVRESYSGRSMYGKKCWGLVTDAPYHVIEVSGMYGLTGAVVDNMGRDYIVYWPDIICDPSRDEDVEDDSEEETEEVE
jgi:hypothetical protein